MKKAFVIQTKFSPSCRSERISGAAVVTTVFSRAARSLVTLSPAMMAQKRKPFSKVGSSGSGSFVSCVVDGAEEIFSEVAMSDMMVNVPVWALSSRLSEDARFLHRVP